MADAVIIVASQCARKACRVVYAALNDSQGLRLCDIMDFAIWLQLQQECFYILSATSAYET